MSRKSIASGMADQPQSPAEERPIAFEYATWKGSQQAALRPQEKLFNFVKTSQLLGLLFIYSLTTNNVWLAAAVIAAIGLWSGYKLYRRRQSLKLVLNQLDLPNPEGQFIAEVGVYVDDVQLGIDKGVITFEGDLLHFESEKNLFDVPNRLLEPTDDGWRRTETPTTYGWSFTVGAIEFPWTTGVAGTKLKVIVYRSRPDSNQDFIDLFQKALEEWLDREPESHTHYILPPITGRIKQPPAVGTARRRTRFRPAASKAGWPYPRRLQKTNNGSRSARADSIDRQSDAIRFV